MKKLISIIFPVLLVACTTVAGNPGGFLVYSFEYKACTGEDIKVTYPPGVKTPDVKDASLHGQEAIAEVHVEPTTGAVKSARLVYGSQKLYASLGDYPQQRSLISQNNECILVRYRVMTFGEIMQDISRSTPKK